MNRTAVGAASRQSTRSEMGGEGLLAPCTVALTRLTALVIMPNELSLARAGGTVKKINTTIDIAATPGVVWDVLTDLAAFQDWNPFIVGAQGEVVPGARLTLRVQPHGGRAMTFRPRITSLDRQRELEWLGHLGLPGLFDGRHHFRLEKTTTGTRLAQSETFTGGLVPLFSRGLDGGTRLGFVAMNEALRDRAEARARAGA